ncbi:MAG: cytochrome b/b6 domain-containing protein [Hyphomicrobiales bacterium]
MAPNKQRQQTSAPTSLDGKLKLVKIWDLPSRLFHWLLAVSVMSGWYLGEYRTFSNIDWHMYLGQATGWLLAFRLYWGFYGPPSAQFKNIVPHRTELVAYIKRIKRRTPSGIQGHNPIGGLSVVALLIVLSIQVTTGFFAEDDGLFASGPMSKYIDSSWVLFANKIHYQSSRIILILIVLHFAAITFYHLWKRENLFWPMITGWKWVRRK